jgi:GxxExxY protein
MPAAGRSVESAVLIAFSSYWPIARTARCATKKTDFRDFLAFPSGALVAVVFGMPIDPSDFNEITGGILAGAIEVHRTLGPGLLESIYAPCLQFELAARNLRFSTQQAVPIVYKHMAFETCYRIDLIVEDKVVVELKSAAALLPVHQAQLLTYMALSDCPAGLLINFNVPRLVDGVKRLINPRASGRSRSGGSARVD